MDPVAYLDTHVVAWLYAGRLDLLPTSVKESIESHALSISPMVELELQYLFEIGRVSEPAENVCGILASTLGLSVCTFPFHEVVQVASRFSWTRDPFDRIITAQSEAARRTLITKDQTILKNCSLAKWE